MQGKEKQYDRMVKILLIGNSGVGKSSLLMQYSDHKFAYNYYNTIGVDYKIKYLTVRGQHIKLQIWDTAGQDRFKTITSSYYRGANGIAIVYDITDRSSFEHVRGWLQQIDKYTDSHIKKYIVGNKSDLQQKRQVTQAQAQEFTGRLGIPFRQTSARLTTNVEELFQDLLERILFSESPSQTQYSEKHSKEEKPLKNEPFEIKKLMQEQKNEQGACCSIY